MVAGTMSGERPSPRPPLARVDPEEARIRDMHDRCRMAIGLCVLVQLIQYLWCCVYLIFIVGFATYIIVLLKQRPELHQSSKQMLDMPYEATPP